MTAYPVLSQKFFVPPPDPKMLVRQRLWPDSRQNRKKLITVIAPAGYGKSTFLGDWVRHSDNRACWYSLHSSDNDLILFLSCVIDSIRSLYPQFGQSLGKLLRVSQPSIETVLVLMIQQIADIEEAFYLILDDYHFIENPQIHENLAYLLHYMPENITLIVSSRSAVPWSLSKWRLADQCLEIGARDLAFTMDETSCLMRTWPVQVDEEQAKIVFQQTEGWATGLQLVLLSCQQTESRHPSFLLGVSKHHIHDYLFEEVFHGLDREIREFLLATACLNQWNESLCQAVTGRPDSRHVFNRLVQSNLFIISLDPERTTFRYHYLFTEFLRNYLASHQPDDVQMYHERAGRWYEANQQYEEAVEHEAAAGNDEKVFALLVKLAPSMLRQGQAVPLIERIRQLDFNLVRTMPELLLYYCWALLLCRQIEEARDIIRDLEDQIMQQLDADGRHPYVPELCLLQSHVCYLQYDFEGMKAYRIKHTRYLPYESEVAGSVEFNPGYARLIRSNLGNFGDYSATGAMLEQTMGYMENTEQANQEVQVERHVWGLMNALNSECLMEKQEFAASEAYLQEAMQVGKELGMLSIYLPAIFTFLQMKTFRDPGYDREPMLQELLSFIREYEAPQWQLALEAFQIYMDLRHGRMDRVDAWLNQSKLATDGPLTLQREYEYLVLCRVWVARDRLPQVVSLIDRLSIIALNERLQGAWIELNLIKSIALHKYDRTFEARDALLVVLRKGKKKGYFMTFVYEGESLLPILAEVLQTKEEPALLAYARSIMEQIQIHSKNGDEFSVKNEYIRQLLTNREFELLTLMADGLTNQEIAEQMKLSIGSVKVYSHRIYHKLHVSNRMQATLMINKNQ
ncbi:LuxR C-terminal-related transcriptional regulator [Paenibacillus sp. J5C_2022]|uniref:LuxR C-terminal-related transcriptional regulator n=1 Tax=Paenibacillus sp. J5C2022 TaxID=2977129 RepID=UPI0021CE678D|nr:LuxR C-terminal-related transcriptional regulator [Paenibacillus sp. J5C2022]MCU6711381.1 LuxR C-terminal-related transcriptional regulator [Paenibacillus sp. J5C2022]